MAYGTVNADVIQSSVSGVSLGAGNASSFKNRIINGAMVINQRSWSGNAVEFGYTLDRWITFVGGANLWSVSQNAGSVTPPTGFTNYLGVTSLAATTPAAGERNLLCQMIEGYNIADWNWGYSTAKTVTISFWVRSSLTGTFGASINSTAQNVSATFSYTINSANTWEQKSITVTGPTTNPAYWDTTNGRGLWLFFDMGTGANFALDTTWGAGGKYTIGSSRTNVVGTNGATWYLTGVQVEVGSFATGFDYRSYGTELNLCQRYLPAFTAQSGTTGPLPGNATALGTNCVLIFNHPVPARVPGTGVTVSSNSHFNFSNNDGNSASTAVSFAAGSPNASQLSITVAVSRGAITTPGWFYANNASAILYITGCEL